MGRVRLTPKEKSLGLREIGGPQQPFITWHDPETGQEFPRLPADAPNAANYLIRGYRMGNAPPELRAKWEAGAADRAALADKRLKKALRSPGHKALKKQLEDVEPDPSDQADVVKKAVQEVLDALGVKLPKQTDEVTDAEPATEAAADEPQDSGADDSEQPAQQKLF